METGGRVIVDAGQAVRQSNQSFLHAHAPSGTFATAVGSSSSSAARAPTGFT
jgi:hypothetical protein